MLWRVSPRPGFSFPFRGKVGRCGVRLCSFIDDEDIAPFTAAADQALVELDAALLAFAPELAGYNDRIGQELKRQVRTY